MILLTARWGYQHYFTRGDSDFVGSLDVSTLDINLSHESVVKRDLLYDFSLDAVEVTSSQCETSNGYPSLLTSSIMLHLVTLTLFFTLVTGPKTVSCWFSILSYLDRLRDGNRVGLHYCKITTLLWYIYKIDIYSGKFILYRVNLPTELSINFTKREKIKRTF